MNYRYINTASYNGDDGPEICDVIENTTEQVIMSNITLPKARELVRHLNFGGGFDGKTPAFFLDAFPLSKNIDDF